MCEEIKNQIDKSKHICKICYNGEVVPDFKENDMYCTGIRRMIWQPALDGKYAMPFDTVAFLSDFQNQAYGRECWNLISGEVVAHVRYIYPDGVFDPENAGNVEVNEMFGCVKISQRIGWNDDGPNYCDEEFYVGEKNLMKIFPYSGYIYLEIDLYNK